MTKEEAIAKYDAKWWIGKTAKEIVDVQLYEKLLCTDFSVFQKAMEDVLGRGVWTHEFADQKALQEEYEGKRQYKGMAETLERIIPKDKPIIFIKEK